jgi:hypothetical protein
MKLISQPEAETILRPFHAVFRAAVREAWKKYTGKVQPTTPLPTRRLRASVMHNYICDEIRKLMGSERGINFIEKSGRFLVSIAGHIVIRFKKLDRKLRPRNYPTQGSLNFNLNLSLPGVPDTSRITIGYSLNNVETEVAGVYAMLFDGKRLEWMYPIEDSAEMALPPSRPEPKPVAPAAPMAPAARRVRAKKPKVDEQVIKASKKAND